MKASVRNIAWERLDGSTTERSQIVQTDDGAELVGRVRGELDAHSIDCRYSVRCSCAWTTERVTVELTYGTECRALELRRDADGRWWRGDDELVSFRGASDIDLSISPMTNCLPIRRLKLEIGASAEVDAVWVGFPELVLERLSQRYTRLGEHGYRYESDGPFSTMLFVDSDGVVVRYGDLWRTIGGRR